MLLRLRPVALVRVRSTALAGGPPVAPIGILPVLLACGPVRVLAVLLARKLAGVLPVAPVRICSVAPVRICLVAPVGVLPVLLACGPVRVLAVPLALGLAGVLPVARGRGLASVPPVALAGVRPVALARVLPVAMGGALVRICPVALVWPRGSRGRLSGAVPAGTTLRRSSPVAGRLRAPPGPLLCWPGRTVGRVPPELAGR